MILSMVSATKILASGDVILTGETSPTTLFRTSSTSWLAVGVVNDGASGDYSIVYLKWLIESPHTDASIFESATDSEFVERAVVSSPEIIKNIKRMK